MFRNDVCGRGKKLSATRMKRKKRNLLGKEWSSLRSDIERSRRELGINSAKFNSLNIYDWERVQVKIEEHFLYQRSAVFKRSWLWNDLKLETYSIQCVRDPYESLNLLIDSNEKVYFIVNETINEQTKYWAYEGTIESISQIIGDSYYLDEYYLVSKKYEWLLATNHHDIFIGTGTILSLMKENAVKIKSANEVV